jgi:hypothetical protein
MERISEEYSYLWLEENLSKHPILVKTATKDIVRD